MKYEWENIKAKKLLLGPDKIRFYIDKIGDRISWCKGWADHLGANNGPSKRQIAWLNANCVRLFQEAEDLVNGVK